jgi:hypothetical protein
MRKVQRFLAAAVSAQDIPDMNTTVMLVAENPDGSGQRLEIQRAMTLDERHESADLDTYCICTETGATHYGGILSYVIQDGSLKISLDRDASAELGVGGFDISFAPARTAAVGSALARLLRFEAS